MRLGLLARLLDTEPGDIEGRREEQGLQACDEQAADDCVVHRSTEDSRGDRSPATTERLAEGLRNSEVRRGGASVHHLSDIAVDLAYVDYVDSGLCCQIAIIKRSEER